jgi:hypothetical protein
MEFGNFAEVASRGSRPRHFRVIPTARLPRRIARSDFFEETNIQQPTLNIQWTNEEMKKSDERIVILFNGAETTERNNER